MREVGSGGEVGCIRDAPQTRNIYTKMDIKLLYA